ncbi:MAG: asparagine synthetase B [Candidatus Zixiibacteriota bacterium]|nr:MAG: asparagine synthetase B [candidate division Zixibacteria bacterium]
MSSASAQRLLIFMDFDQTDHLKAYGVAYWCLEQGYDVEWLLNYRGGSFMSDYADEVAQLCKLRGVAYSAVSPAEEASIRKTIEDNNMESVLLEKAPKVAIYAPPISENEPWDDAVNLALTYAEIPFEVIWDEELLAGKLHDYDWVHLHHEDFTGQYGKFYGSYRNALWYKQNKALNEATAQKLGFRKVSRLKLAVARAIKEYVAAGGFLFAMCSATDTYDIALSAEGVDIVPTELDGDPTDPDCQERLDYSKTFAFENFGVELNPMVYEHSDIDTSPTRGMRIPGPEADYFALFDFSAKYDPVPTMLIQNHVPVVNGFLGQCTGFHKDKVKRYITVLGETEGKGEVKYLHGNFGRGTFTFLGGHDPEDYRHMIGDPPTQLELHKNSPGYRLILNNVLFPAARKKERKT